MKLLHWVSLGLIVLLSGVIVYQNIFDPVNESPRSVKPDFPRAGKSLVPVNETSTLEDPNQSADVSEDVKRHIAFMEGRDPLDPRDKDWLKGVVRDRLTHAGIPVSETFVEAKVMEYINAAPGSRPSMKSSALISPSVPSLNPAVIAFAPQVAPPGSFSHSVKPSSSNITPPSEGEELSEEEKRHVTYSLNLAFGKPTPLDPRDVEWWKGVIERRAKEQEARTAWAASLPPEDPRKRWSKNIPADRAKIKDFLKNFNKVRGLPPVDDASLEEAINSLPTWVNLRPLTTTLDPRDVEWLKNPDAMRNKETAERQVKASLPPEDEGRLWDKNIPAERAKIKDSLRDYRKALGLPIDDASLEEAVNRTTTEITPVDREGNPINLR